MSPLVSVQDTTVDQPVASLSKQVEANEPLQHGVYLLDVNV
eukprot:CAMPEP_0118644152 /NCGR_PEP_ID=MMETSP0785-20121206/6780_1 /TAXON_ID=91992 /ORGANISM="Bolidomonas pacifica, Strain CCMP 1866" /LENGTH=40 /DNA_ID= /DNA_START= /DNA_END= /DNA_ORIENTATION=